MVRLVHTCEANANVNVVQMHRTFKRRTQKQTAYPTFLRKVRFTGAIIFFYKWRSIEAFRPDRRFAFVNYALTTFLG